MFNRAIPGQRLPKRVSTDHDPHFRFHRWLANLRVLEIEEIKAVPYAPVSHFVERLIGTIRRLPGLSRSPLDYEFAANEVPSCSPLSRRQLRFYSGWPFENAVPARQ